MMISPLGPTAASCLMPPPKREPMPAAIITRAVFMIFLLILTPLVYCAFFFFGDSVFIWGATPASAPTRHDMAKLLIAAYRHGVLYKAGPSQIDDQRGKQQHDAEVEQRRQQICAAFCSRASVRASP